MPSKEFIVKDEKHSRNVEIFSKEKSNGIDYELFGISNEVIDGYTLEDDIKLLSEKNGFIIY